MSKKRIAVRAQLDGTLSNEEQQQFVDDYYHKIDGTGIRGYFICGPKTGWIEWEGDSGPVEEKVDEFEADGRVASSDRTEDTSIASVGPDEWMGHALPDAQDVIS